MKPITLTLLPSRRLLLLLVVAGLFFSLMLFLVPIPPWLRMVVLLLVLLSTGYFCLRDALLWLPWSYTAIPIAHKNQLRLTQKSGKQVEMHVLANTVVTAYLTVLNGQFKEATLLQKLIAKHLIILPDAVEAEDYRQLRVWLRWSKVIAPQTKALAVAEDQIV